MTSQKLQPELDQLSLEGWSGRPFPALQLASSTPCCPFLEAHRGFGEENEKKAMAASPFEVSRDRLLPRPLQSYLTTDSDFEMCPACRERRACVRGLLGPCAGLVDAA